MPYLKTDSSGPIEIYYEDQGDPVVLIGGLTAVAEYWGLQIPALAERYRVIAPDNRGSGRTLVLDDDGVRSTELFAADLLALIDGLGLERVHLIGQSMGGMIVQTFALAHPDRLRFLVIASVGPGGSDQVTAGDAFADLEESARGGGAN